MPDMHFYVEWPDGVVTRCYSPSTVIREYFETGMALTIAELRERSAEALERASERVRAKYGFACTRSSAQLADIEARAQAYREEERVKIVNVLLAAEDVSSTGALT